MVGWLIWCLRFHLNHRNILIHLLNPLFFSLLWICLKHL
jgi:hypothetical protein